MASIISWADRAFLVSPSTLAAASKALSLESLASCLALDSLDGAGLADVFLARLVFFVVMVVSPGSEECSRDVRGVTDSYLAGARASRQFTPVFRGFPQKLQIGAFL